ncbi:hypothetical protein K493DRAFT_322069, partial [Basidiobolus meristosporus CBS 931.73]
MKPPGQTQESIPYHTYTEENVASTLETDIQVGLTTNEAKQRLEKYGPNEMSGQGGPSAFRVLFRQIANALTLVLIIAMAIAFSAGGNYGEGGKSCGRIHKRTGTSNIFLLAL